MSRIDHTEHNRHVAEMEARHAETGQYIDPVTGRELPTPLVRDPNREQRRRLARWRKRRR